LNLEKEYLEDHQVKITVTVDDDVFESSKRKAARMIAKRTRISGFRPGKAPYTVIARQVGEGVIIEEAIDLVVNDIYPELLDEAEIEPFGPGTLEEIKNLEPLELEFLIPLQAEVELGDYLSIRIDYEPQEIGDKDVDDVINNLRERQAIIEPVERAAEESDQVYIILEAIRTGDDDDQDSKLIENRKLPIIIEAQDEEDSDGWPYPGFSRQLIGHKTGDELTLNYSFPVDAPYESLRDVEAEFHVEIEDVRGRSLPDFDDEFAKSVGEYETTAEFRAEIQSELEHQETQRYNNEYDNRVIEAIIADAKISYPPQMLERGIDNVINKLTSDLAQQNLDMDLYLKTRQQDMDGLREEVTPVAEERIQKSLTLIELSKAEDIQVEPDELQDATNQTLGQISQSFSDKDFRAFMKDKGTTSNVVSNIMYDMVTARTSERIRNIARGIPTPPEEEQPTEASEEGLDEAGTLPDAEAEAGADAAPVVEQDEEEGSTVAAGEEITDSTTEPEQNNDDITEQDNDVELSKEVTAEVEQADSK
jgi:trigger factor